MGLYLTEVAGTQYRGLFYFGVDPWFFTCRDPIYKRLNLSKDCVNWKLLGSLSRAVQSMVLEAIKVWLGLKR